MTSARHASTPERAANAPVQTPVTTIPAASSPPASSRPASAPADIVWLDGRLTPIGEARVGILDRGFLFGDGVYELIRFFDGVGVGMDLHVRRLETSLRLARIEGFDADAVPRLCETLLRANDLVDASIYVQVTRGAAAQRTHVPPPGLRPTVMALATSAAPLDSLRGPEPVRAVVLPDERWLRCEIKTISLMGNVLAAMAAAERGADEAILHRDGVLSEGGSTNVFLWTRSGRLATPATNDGPPILHGVSRLQLIEAARREGIAVEERRIHVEELVDAEEVMITSSRRLLSSVVELDGRAIGPHGGASGAFGAGATARRLFELIRPRP